MMHFEANKWIVLGCYCLANGAATIDGTAFASIAKDVATWYGVSFNAVNQLAFIGYLCPFLTMVPAMWLADTSYFEVSFYSTMLFSLLLRCIRSVFPGPGTAHFFVLLGTQLFLSLSSPLLSCLAPVLSKLYFPRHQRAIATSLGTVSGIVGMGVGLTTSPLYKNDIPGLFVLQVALTVIPLFLSVFCLDFLICFTKGKVGRDTSYRRLVRQLSSTLGLRTRTATPYTPMHLPFLSSTTALPTMLNAENNPRLHQDGIETREQEDSDQESLTEIKSTNYMKTLRRILTDFAFIRLMFATGLMTGVVYAWIALVSEAAPPSVDNAQGAQLICGIFFGFGTLGTVVFGLILDKTRAYLTLARCLLLTGFLPSVLAMYGWHANVALYIYVGMAVTGFVCMPLYPLSIEYGIELVFCPNEANVGAAVSGIMTLFCNVLAVVIIVATTPGNIPGLEKEYIPLVWACINATGALLFLTLPPRYGRQLLEQQQSSSSLSQGAE